MESFDLKHYLRDRKEWVEEALQRLLPWEQSPAPQLDAAMRHSLLDGGKRLRPILLLACAEALGSTAEPLLPFACALECIHTYSLIHDDLPAMDNDDWRRGRPTCHKQFDEATAILAGDALLTLAFELAAQPIAGVAPLEQLALLRLLAQGAGMAGMVGGQMLDMLSEKKQLSLEALQTVHACKTGALIRVACLAGAHLGGGTPEQCQRLADYGRAIGLAFQIVDDILDETGDSQLLGKATGQDRHSVKATYPRLLGLPGAQQEAERQVDQAIAALAPFSQHAEPLRYLARFILTRTQ
ncbi:MAG: polyprenyl synthetase family protein [Magnetococcales bacterium]|nr:polyprenyl synthetase family protein [Magnetococcales bacterium]